MIESTVNYSEKVAHGPKIIIDTELYQKEVPYTLRLDSNGFGAFLKEQGFSQEKIDNTTVSVKKNSTTPSFVPNSGIASFNLIDSQITIFGDRIWRLYENLAKSIENLSEGKNLISKFRSKQKLKKHLYTKRLPEYLQEAPSERGLDFANDLILQGVNREASVSLLKKSAILEGRTSTAIFIFARPPALAQTEAIIAGALFSQLPMTGEPLADSYLKLGISIGLFRGVLMAESHINPLIRHQAKINREYKNKHQYRKIISIEPKSRGERT